MEVTSRATDHFPLRKQKIFFNYICLRSADQRIAEMVENIRSFRKIISNWSVSRRYLVNHLNKCLKPTKYKWPCFYNFHDWHDFSCLMWLPRNSHQHELHIHGLCIISFEFFGREIWIGYGYAMHYAAYLPPILNLLQMALLHLILSKLFINILILIIS